jgi:hypothetical protein
MRLLAQLVLWVAIVMFTGVGLTGVLFGAWEFDLVVPVALDAIGDNRATFMNQLRFLKALELGVGIMLFALRRDVLESAVVNRAVVAVLWVTPLARVVSLGLDGAPHPSFIALMAVELSGAIVMTAYSLSRFRPRGSRPAASVGAATSG